MLEYGVSVSFLLIGNWSRRLRQFKESSSKETSLGKYIAIYEMKDYGKK